MHGCAHRPRCRETRPHSPTCSLACTAGSLARPPRSLSRRPRPEQHASSSSCPTPRPRRPYFLGMPCTMDRVHIHFKTHICRRLVPTYLPTYRTVVIPSSHLFSHAHSDTTTTQEGASYDRSTHAPRTIHLLTLHLPPPSREDAVMVYACTHSCGTAPIL